LSGAGALQNGPLEVSPPHLSSSHLIFIFPSHLSPSPSPGAKGEQRPTGVRGRPSRRGGRGPPYAGRARVVANVCVWPS
jgi:hypothetical protein